MMPSSQRHPDKNKNPGAEDMFIKITKSYEVSNFYVFQAVSWNESP